MPGAEQRMKRWFDKAGGRDSMNDYEMMQYAGIHYEFLKMGLI